MNPADAWIDAHGADLVAWRRRIHAHPELARQEFATTALVVDTLRAVGLSPTVMATGQCEQCRAG